MSWIDPRTARSLGAGHYHGMTFGWTLLVVLGLLNLFRGGIHVFKSDGGAASIAGIDLSQNAEVILTLFAAMGVAQLLMGVIDLAVGLRFRALVPLLLGYHLVHQIAAALVVWWWKPLPVEAPGKFGAVALIPVVALGLFSALRRRDAARGNEAATTPVSTQRGVEA
jgi:hypothetical protein